MRRCARCLTDEDKILNYGNELRRFEDELLCTSCLKEAELEKLQLELRELSQYRRESRNA